MIDWFVLSFNRTLFSRIGSAEDFCLPLVLVRLACTLTFIFALSTVVSVVRWHPGIFHLCCTFLRTRSDSINPLPLTTNYLIIHIPITLRLRLRTTHHRESDRKAHDSVARVRLGDLRERGLRYGHPRPTNLGSELLGGAVSLPSDAATRLVLSVAVRGSLHCKLAEPETENI